MIKQQGDIIDELTDIIEEHIKDLETNRLDEERVDKLILQVIITLLDYRLMASKYYSGIISRLAVLSICKDGS